MSQYAFCQIVSNIDALIAAGGISDVKGYPLEEWDNNGFVGWDPSLNTYFLQLDVGDPPAWWITDPNGIKSFADLCTVVNDIFQQPPGVFHFHDIISKT